MYIPDIFFQFGALILALFMTILVNKISNFNEVEFINCVGAVS